MTSDELFIRSVALRVEADLTMCDANYWLDEAREQVAKWHKKLVDRAFRKAKTVIEGRRVARAGLIVDGYGCELP